ncbi:MAG TPA: protein-glutamate O-methyltransferase CheR [Patescibacteria group bacterium]|nr:protein-glutamate O-methyltransferase CheR [Patescibacteria group bacterium]
MLAISDQDFSLLTDYVKRNFGINLSQKRTLIEGRLSNLVLEKGFGSFAEYLQFVFSDASRSEITVLLDKLTTNHTFFMRENEHFWYFRDQVLPYLRSNVKSRDLRIWSAGCSTGQEPYTLAMLIAEFLGAEKSVWDAKILATDISSSVLQTAAQGCYPADSLSDIPASWKLNYFRKPSKDWFQVTEAIKKEVVFRRFNLIGSEFPFRRKFHVIFCRNVMIYFEQPVKMNLVRMFHEFTEPGGYLFLGLSEGLGRHESEYVSVMPAIYRKR